MRREIASGPSGSVRTDDIDSSRGCECGKGILPLCRKVIPIELSCGVCAADGPGRFAASGLFRRMRRAQVPALFVRVAGIEVASRPFRFRFV